MAQILINQDDYDKTFKVKLDDMVTIALKENATSGYRWKQDRVDEKIILLENSQYCIQPNSAIGGGGIRTFNFRPKSVGKATVQLSLERQWQKKESY